MSLAAEVLRDLERAFGSGAPRVRALHVPPAPWTGNKDGEFAALELDDGAVGLSYVLLGDTLEQLARGACRETVEGSDALALARCWSESDATRRAVGFAAVNALTRSLFERVRFVPPVARDSLAGIDPQAGEHVGMVGFFPPLVREVVTRGARLTILELKAELAGDRDGFRVTLAPADLAGCEKVLATSTLLLNDTLDEVLAACAQARVFALVGPGASCLPDALFRRGVTVMAGAWITEPEPFKPALCRGDPWGRYAQKFALQRADYPGIDALLARAG